MCCYIAVALALLATVGPTVSRTTPSTSVSSDAPSNTYIMATTRSNVDPATAMQVGISQPVLSRESGQTYCRRAGPIQYMKQLLRGKGSSHFKNPAPPVPEPVYTPIIKYPLAKWQIFHQRLQEREKFISQMQPKEFINWLDDQDIDMCIKAIRVVQTMPDYRQKLWNRSDLSEEYCDMLREYGPFRDLFN
ncbi:hypothetical protein BC835DRAFT_1308455 [Cytidiella melzeri]|nr:hypothetical protein BC835DRAFT_1308455 [Cytidiella melzeri]